MNLTITLILQIITLYAVYFVASVFLLRWIWNTCICDIFTLRKIVLNDSFKLVLLFHFVLGGFVGVSA